MARLPRKASESIKAGNRLRNEVQLMINRGEIDDPDFLRAIKTVGEGRDVSDIAGDYYDVVIPKRNKDGKVALVAKEREHGLGSTPATLRAILAAEQTYRGGGSDFQRNPQEVQRMADFLQKNVTQGSLSSIGVKGAREVPTPDEKVMRAAALLIDTDKGRDPVTGMPFNTMMSKGTTPLDAGHFIAHASRPDLSNSPYNIGWQNQYENKGQAHAEKIAGQQGREATNEELADALFKTFINKITKDVVLPRKGRARDEFMAPINAKLDKFTDLRD